MFGATASAQWGRIQSPADSLLGLTTLDGEGAVQSSLFKLDLINGDQKGQVIRTVDAQQHP
jgi:hypothetical protein